MRNRLLATICREYEPLVSQDDTTGTPAWIVQQLSVLDGVQVVAGRIDQFLFALTHERLAYSMIWHPGYISTPNPSDGWRAASNEVFDIQTERNHYYSSTRCVTSAGVTSVPSVSSGAVTATVWRV